MLLASVHSTQYCHITCVYAVKPLHVHDSYQSEEGHNYVFILISDMSGTRSCIATQITTEDICPLSENYKQVLVVDAYIRLLLNTVKQRYLVYKEMFYVKK